METRSVPIPVNRESQDRPLVANDRGAKAVPQTIVGVLALQKAPVQRKPT